VKRLYSHIAMTFAMVLPLACLWMIEKARASASATPSQRAAARAQLGDEVTVHAAQRGFPRINLSDGHDLLAPFAATPEVVAPSAAEAGGVTPLGLTTADLDGDGVADLVCSYDSPQGAFIAVYRGNVDALHPNSLAAQQRRAAGSFTDAPFLAPARVFATPVAGQLLVASDVDGDGHQDVVITSRASRSLFVMAGDGKGSIRLAKEVALPGTVSALAAGEVDCRDGLTDILVGVVSDNGARALIFQGPSGAMNAEPESFALPAVATDFAIGQFDDDLAADVVVAAGRSLLMIHGRERRPLAGAASAAGQAKIDRHDLSFNVMAITSGRFGEGRQSEVGLLGDDGAVYVASFQAQAAGRKSKANAARWAIDRLATAQANPTRLLMAHLSSQAADALLLLDAGGRQMRIIETATETTGAALAARNATVDLNVEGEAVAALPMRLNGDALDDLVILRRGAVQPTIMTSAPANIFTVTNNGDNGGVNPPAGAGTGTLRQAIIDANATAALDTIQFNIGSGPVTIVASGVPLPTIIAPVTIDGTTQPGFAGTPIVQLSAISVGGNGLNIQTNNTTVTGLVISNFGGFGISISGNSGNIIDGNYIGTNIAGTAAAANSQGGVQINAATGNQIGTASGGNLISGNNGPGIALIANASSNQVRSNSIGTNAAGTAALHNSGSGIDIQNSPGNTIGGTSGSRNLISGNFGNGITTTGNLVGTLVQGNFIGTDSGGASGVANANGINLGSATTGVTVGGTAAGAGNIIAFNAGRGVNAAADSETNSILGNAIFSNEANGIDLNSDGVTPNDGCDGDTGANGLQNFPTISAVSAGAATVIQGTLNSVAGTNYRLEFFQNSACDPSGNGEGQNFIGFTNAMTDAACNATFNVSLPVTVMPGDVITATATDSLGNTSEFSPCFTVTATSANFSIEADGQPNPVDAGTDLTYMMGIFNAGPDTATNVVLSTAVPANTTFQSLEAPAGWTCSTPAVGGTGTITCTIPSLANSGSGDFTLVVRVNPAAADGSVIHLIATISSNTPDPDTSNNTADIMTNVVAAPCTFNCPNSFTANTNPTQCGANVDYPVPTATSDCGTVACSPAPGSFFPRGATTVTCTLSSGPGGPASQSCSFVITVLDQTPPVVTCPGNITAGTSAGSNSTAVDYPIATATDACGVADVVCLPPSGSTFALGTSTVTCTAKDTSNNTSTCTFTVTVSDKEAPVIRCPDNVSQTVPATQTSAVVNYPAPTVTDNQPGVTVTCVPPSGSTFPLGTSTVTCVALDVSGNRASCGFSVTLTGGPTSLDVVIPTGQPSLQLSATPKRKNKNRTSSPCAAFSIVNRGFSRVTLSFDSILRTGSDVTSGRISDPREGDTYLLSLINADGSERPLSIGDTLALAANGRLNFCLRFNPLIPPLTGSNTGLSAPQAIPDVVTSRVNFGIAGGGTLSVNVNANVATALQLINPNNPRKPATVTFTRSGDELTVSFAIYDPNLDVKNARYEFLDGTGALVAGPFDVDLTQVIRDSNLVRGQSFLVTQRFVGANSNPNVSAVRVTVSDGETSVTSPTTVLGTTASASFQTASRRRLMSIEPPPARLGSPLP
jgi:uncharacterized repeat protein (TIGR01451 family)